MTAGARLLWIETRRSVALWFFPVLAAVGWWLASQDAEPAGLATWLHTSAAIGLSMLLVAPLACGLGAWAAGRDRRRGISDLLASTPYASAARDVIGWCAITLWIIMAYLVGGLALVLSTGSLWVWGRPYPSFIIVGLAGIVAATALGLLTGTVVRSRLAPPLVAIALYVGLLYVGDNNPTSYRYLSPVTILRPYEYDVFREVYLDTFLPTLLWLAGIAGTALALVAVIRQRSLLTVGACVATIVTAGSGAMLLLDAGTGRMPSPAVAPYDPVCVESAIEVCVHPAYEPLLDDTADVIADLVEPLVGISGGPLRAEQLSSGAQSLQPDGTLGIIVGERRDVVMVTAAMGLVWDEAVAPSERASAAQVVIGRWLMQRTGVSEEWLLQWWLLPWNASGTSPSDALLAEVDAALQRFAAIDPAEQRAWLEHHFVDLRAGRISLDELP